MPRTAAVRFLAHEPLYRPDDGHYQYKYFPAFAQLMVPFTWVSKEVAQFTWFTLTVAMTWAFVSLSIAALPERRLSVRVLFWLTLLLNGKFLVKELAFGQFNLPVALADARRRDRRAARPWARGWSPRRGRRVRQALCPRAGAVAGLDARLAPARSVRPRAGWRAAAARRILRLERQPDAASRVVSHRHRYDRTEPARPREHLVRLDVGEVDRAGHIGRAPRAGSAVVAVAAGIAVMWRRRHVAEPNYLEGAYFFVLIPLLSPQGWDYVLLIALPAYMCLVDRWRDLSPNWRAVALTGFFLTSFTIFDLLRRPLYTHLMELAAVSVGAVLIAACLIRLRWRALA